MGVYIYIYEAKMFISHCRWRAILSKWLYSNNPLEQTSEGWAIAVKIFQTKTKYAPLSFFYIAIVRHVIVLKAALGSSLIWLM